MIPVAPQALRDYALLADGERGVLVGPRGEFAWMCFPRWHDDAVFSSLWQAGWLLGADRDRMISSSAVNDEKK
jgi:hypothetical protein